MTPLALIVSPHLDDAAFSIGATAAALRRAGWRVALATVFTRSVARPAGFALACQLDKGLAADVDYLALRRAEDAEAGRRLGLDPVSWLDLPEAPHRGYGSAPALFAGAREDDRVAAEVAGLVGGLVDRLDPALVLGPQGVGNHVDHLQVIAALRSLPGCDGRIAWYRDLPYAAKRPDARPSATLPPGLVDAAVPIGGADLVAKLDASAAYITQVPFQFDGDGPMRRLLFDFAAAEGARLGLAGPAEPMLAPPGLAERLGRVDPD